MQGKSKNQAEGRSHANPKKVTNLADRKLDHTSARISHKVKDRAMKAAKSVFGYEPKFEPWLQDVLLREAVRLEQLAVESEQLKKASGQ